MTLDEIQARADAATEGPWEVTTLDLLVYVADESGTLDPILCGYVGNNGPRRDANFIAHAREDVPKLVAALRTVENLAKHWETCAPGDRYYARMVRAAIRDALAS